MNKSSTTRALPLSKEFPLKFSLDFTVDGRKLSHRNLTYQSLKSSWCLLNLQPPIHNRERIREVTPQSDSKMNLQNDSYMTPQPNLKMNLFYTKIHSPSSYKCTSTFGSSQITIRIQNFQKPTSTSATKYEHSYPRLSFERLFIKPQLRN